MPQTNVTQACDGADTRRLDWLEAHPDRAFLSLDSVDEEWKWAWTFKGRITYATSFRAAIDAAMASEGRP